MGNWSGDHIVVLKKVVEIFDREGKGPVLIHDIAAETRLSAHQVQAAINGLAQHDPPCFTDVLRAVGGISGVAAPTREARSLLATGEERARWVSSGWKGALVLALVGSSISLAQLDSPRQAITLTLGLIGTLLVAFALLLLKYRILLIALSCLSFLAFMGAIGVIATSESQSGPEQLRSAEPALTTSTEEGIEVENSGSVAQDFFSSGACGISVTGNPDWRYRPCLVIRDGVVFAGVEATNTSQEPLGLQVYVRLHRGDPRTERYLENKQERTLSADVVRPGGTAVLALGGLPLGDAWMCYRSHIVLETAGDRSWVASPWIFRSGRACPLSPQP